MVYDENTDSENILTKTKVIVGISQHWKDNSIPDEFKNGNDVIICPYSKYYLSHIKLFPEKKYFHNLPKSEYFEYQYIPKYNILRKTHELSFI